MDRHLDEGACVARGAKEAPELRADGDRGAAGTTSLGGPDFGPGVDGSLDRLGAHLVRFELSARAIVVELEVGGRRVGLARPVPEGEHDLLGLASLVLADAEGVLPALVAGRPLRCS